MILRFFCLFSNTFMNTSLKSLNQALPFCAYSLTRPTWAVSLQLSTEFSSQTGLPPGTVVAKSESHPTRLSTDASPSQTGLCSDPSVFKFLTMARSEGSMKPGKDVSLFRLACHFWSTFVLFTFATNLQC